MSRRRAWSLSLVVLTTWSSVAFGPWSADAAEVTEVGGGAAGVQARAAVTSVSAFASVAEPRVELPPEGSEEPITDELAPLAAPLPAGLEVHLARVTTQGTPAGDPFAHSTVDVEDVRLGSTAIRAVSTRCTWDEEGASATTVLRLADRETIEPPPNTAIEIPGLGSAVLNHQTRRTLSSGAEVITVSGVHLTVEPDGPSNLDLEVDIAFASCDPLKLPVVTDVQAGGGER